MLIALLHSINKKQTNNVVYFLEKSQYGRHCSKFCNYFDGCNNYVGIIVLCIKILL